MTRNVALADVEIKRLLDDINKGGLVSLRWTTKQLRDSRPELLIYTHNSFDRWWQRLRDQRYNPNEPKVATPIRPQTFLYHGDKLTNASPKKSRATRLADFKVVFGTTPDICSVLWGMLDVYNSISQLARPTHMHFIT